MTDEQSKRRRISELMREAASLFTGPGSPNLVPALPKMQAAVDLAHQLDDKTPLVICQVNLARMNAVCGNVDAAMAHIEHAIRSALANDLALSTRNVAFSKFVEIAVLLRREHERALVYARALVQSAADEESNYGQFLAALINLAVVCQELLGESMWAMSVLSWVHEHAAGPYSSFGQQASRMYLKTSAKIVDEHAATWLAELEANRDEYLRIATAGFLPDFAPPPSQVEEE